MAGRETKLTVQVRDRVAHAIRQGNYACVAAAYAGIGESTFYRWLQQGEQEEEGIYRDFWEAVKDAEAEAEVQLVEKVNLHAADNWQAGMTILERRFPERWRRRDEHNYRNLSDEELIKRAESLFGGGRAPWINPQESEPDDGPQPLSE